MREKSVTIVTIICRGYILRCDGSMSRREEEEFIQRLIKHCHNFPYGTEYDGTCEQCGYYGHWEVLEIAEGYSLVVHDGSNILYEGPERFFVEWSDSDANFVVLGGDLLIKRLQHYMEVANDQGNDDTVRYLSSILDDLQRHS